MIFLDGSLPTDFFTKASFATLAGATGIVLVMCGTIQSVFNYNPKWLALLISIMVSCTAAAVITGTTNAPPEPKPAPQTTTGNTEPAKDNKVWTYVFAVLNGFLIYASATGANQVLGRPNPSRPPTPPPVPPPPPPPGGPQQEGPQQSGARSPQTTNRRTFGTRWWS